MEQRYRAVVEYDGTELLGFQIQAQGRTVQGELEAAIQSVCRYRSRVAGAGRTDAGVHAVGQVVAFNTLWRHSAEDLQRALNATLPPEIAVRDVMCVDRSFSPRFDARWRQYRYTILNRAVRSPLIVRFAHLVTGDLDIEAMQVASQKIPGVHDFAAFGRAPQGDNTVRHIRQAEWMAEGEVVTFEITANAFLYRMVRNIVGTMLQVGRGEKTSAAFVELLASRDRRLAGPPAPAKGLCLVKVVYAE
jgi:tRNA pseudouridine38-40 synthase